MLRDFETACGITVPRSPQASTSPFLALPSPPHGFSIKAAAPDCQTQLVGRKILYWWPGEGWQLGSVVLVLVKACFSHVVAYNKTSQAIRGTTDSLLD